MNIVGSKAGAKAMLLRQLSSFFFLSDAEEAAVSGEFDNALARCERSFSKTRNKYYSEAGATRFDPLQGCQWSRFLYELAALAPMITLSPISQSPTTLLFDSMKTDRPNLG